jgi:hypothetical protein
MAAEGLSLQAPNQERIRIYSIEMDQPWGDAAEDLQTRDAFGV